jgi:hypothetical protein
MIFTAYDIYYFKFASKFISCCGVGQNSLCPTTNPGTIIEQMAAIVELNAFYAASRWGCYIP